MKKLKILLLTVLSLTVTNSYASELKPGINAVIFVNHGDTISANLFLPNNYDRSKKYPAIVLTPPASGVKEQTIGLYAKALCEKGYITLAFDPRGWGESQGIPYLMDPYRITDDTKTAVSYILTLDAVDSKNVYNMGLCMGAAFAGMATALDSRIKALIMVSPYIDGAKQFYEGFGNNPHAIRNTVLKNTANARQKYFETGEITHFQAIPRNEEEIEPSTMQISREMMDYYLPGKPGGVSTWDNAFNMITLEQFMSWSVEPYIYLLEPVPTLVIYGEKAVSADGAEKFFQAKKGPKEKMVIKGKGHFDLYHKNDCVKPSIEKIHEYITSL